jgi:membrane protease subunit (stomatin/prohibitin family)
MAIVNRVKWDGLDDTYAWKYPSVELSKLTQLIVNESQEAVLIREGKMIGPLPPGRHTLDTKNIPLLSKLFKIPTGGDAPFTAEVWFVNKTMPLDVKWGTMANIQLQDPKYNVMLPIRAFGQYGVQVVDTRKFITKLVGTLPSFDREKMISYFRGIILTNVKSFISKQIIKEKISVLEISAHLGDISKSLRDNMTEELDDFGLRLINFQVNSINTPEDDPAVIRLKDALAKKAEMDIIGFNYQQQRSFDTMEKAAGNEGSANAGLMGAGLGLGMGVGLGGPMGGAMGGMADELNTSTPKKLKDQETFECDKCGQKMPKGAKFCSGCGDPFLACQKCGTDNSENEAQCRKCGEDLPVPCPKCKMLVSGDHKFCPSCGSGLSIKNNCNKCNRKLSKNDKFCPKCGTSREK